jgi:tetratricopeptide (TPR) repeat protein
MKAVAMAEESKRKPLIAHAYMNAGNICFMQGLFDMAVKHYYAAMNFNKELGNPDGVAQALTNLGGIQLQLHKFEESKEYFNEAFQTFSDLSQKRGDTIPSLAVISIYNNLGIAYENLQDYNQAIDYYQRGISLAKRIPGQSRNLAMLYNNLGSSYMKRGNPADAIENMEQALKIRTESLDKTGEASSHRMMGIFFYTQKNYERALASFYRGIALAEEVGSTPIISGITEKLFDTYKVLNNADSALKYHILFKKYADQLKNEETLREFTRMEIVSQYQEKEKIQQIERRRQTLRHLLIAIVLLFLVVFLGLLFILSQSRLRRLNLLNRNIQLASEKAELEREAMAHALELKNKELTTNVMYQIRKNELISSIAGKLMANSHNFKKENQGLINEIIRELEDTQEETVWNEFEQRFHQVHNQFYDQLNAINPDLSPNERRLCAFLRLNMSSKEISSITGQSLRSIEVARTRLRKKLDLTNSEVGLIEFLSTL